MRPLSLVKVLELQRMVLAQKITNPVAQIPSITFPPLTDSTK
jgi:hypothetical protein